MASRKKKKGGGGARKPPSEARARHRDGDEDDDSTGDSAPASDIGGGGPPSISSTKRKGASWPGYAVIGVLVAAGIFAVVKGSSSGSSDSPSGDSTSKVATGQSEPPEQSPSNRADGLKITDVVVGKGAEAKSGDKVTVHYVGTLPDGKEFDASKKHGEEGFTFDLGQGRVIKGWDEGVAGMRVGGKRKLVIPPELGYGARGAGELIPPNSTLHFEVELLSVTRDGKKVEGADDHGGGGGGGDPLKGSFSIADATADLPGKGPLMAKIETSNGTMTCRLFDDKAPITVANFVGLATGKRPFKDPKTKEWSKRPAYDGTSFHRIIKGFMIQGGDPKGDGTGEPGYVIKDEIWDGAKHDKAGLLCMANRGPNTNGAQFFITDASAPHLDRSYTIFGECSPEKVIHDIANVKTGANDRPETPVAIKKVTISRGE